MWLQSRQVKPAPEYKKESHLKEAPPSGGDLKDYTTVISDLSSVQLLSRVQFFATPWTAAGQDEDSEKAGFKLSIQKLTSWHPVPSLHGK